MPEHRPDHRDAELILKLYDLRREPVMRASRDTMIKEFMPGSFEDLVAIADLAHPLNTAYRQTTSYWEMVYGMGHHGIVEPEYLVENNGEGLLTYVKICRFLPRLRDEFSPIAFQHSEWAATQTAVGRRYVELMQGRLAALIQGGGGGD
jgi:hypothetical protein